MHLHFSVQKAKISGDATCSAESACQVSLLISELCMHACSPLLRCVLAPSMHSRFPVQSATISGDVTCSAKYACYVRLLSREGGTEDGGGVGGGEGEKLQPRTRVRRHSTIHTRTRHLARHETPFYSVQR
jgi:hypothetical protein